MSRSVLTVGTTILESLENIQFNYVPENKTFVTPSIGKFRVSLT